MDVNSHDFIFVRYDPETDRHYQIHFVDILLLCTSGVNVTLNIFNTDKLQTSQQYKKYKFLLECIKIRHEHLNNLELMNDEVISLIDPDDMDIDDFMDIDTFPEILEFSNKNPFLS